VNLTITPQRLCVCKRTLLALFVLVLSVAGIATFSVSSAATSTAPDLNIVSGLVHEWLCLKSLKPSAKGAEYKSQGQSAKRVAPGYKRHEEQGLKGRNNEHYAFQRAGIV